MKPQKIFKVACLLWMLMLVGCGNEPGWQREDPVEVLRGYLLALDTQDVEGVCAYLASDTRAYLDGVWQKHREDLENRRPNSCYLLRSGHVPSSTREYKKIEVKSISDAEAELEIVMLNETRWPVRLRRENTRWAVALPLQAEVER